MPVIIKFHTPDYCNFFADMVKYYQSVTKEHRKQTVR